MRKVLPIIVLSCLVVLSCSKKGEHQLKPSPEYGEGAPLCNKRTSEGHTIPIQVLQDNRLDEVQTMSAIDIARDFFSSYGIAFCMLDPPRGIGRLDIFHAKTTQGDEYREKPVDRKNASDRFLIPLREFIRTYASPAQRAINVVFVPTLLDERHPLSSHFAELEGFAILPRNLTTVQNFQKHQLVDQIGIDQFTPSVIIDLPAETSDFYPIGMTLAHEVGHVLGLAHVDDTSNLMSASKDNKALRGLNPAQVRALKNALFFSVFQKSKAKTGLNRSRGPSEIE